MPEERTKYADSILTTKSPYEATEIIRIRLSQAKLLNKDFYLLFKEISDIKRNYTQQLRKILAENEDLDKLLKSQMLETQVLTAKEMGNFEFESLGDLKILWESIIDVLRTELRANSDLYHALNNEIIQTLERSTENDTKWSESKRLHSKLSQIAATIEHCSRNGDRDGKLNAANNQWDSEVPSLFELFETIDFNRLEILKNSSLRYQTGMSDYLLNMTKQSEKAMTKMLEFEPQNEVDRFAREASRYSFQTLSSEEAGKNNVQSSAGSKNKRKSTLSNIGHRFSSNSTVLHHDLMDGEFSSSENNVSLKEKKSGNKLKSKVGSIFSRNKLKSKKSSTFNKPMEATIAETTHSPVNKELSNRSSSATPSSEASQAHRPTMQNRDSDSLYKVSNHQTRNGSFKTKPTLPAAPEHEPSSQQEPLEAIKNERDSSRTPLSITQAPLQPQTKSKQTSSESQAEREQVPTTVSDPTTGTQKQAEAKGLHIRAPALPPSRKQNITNRNSEIFRQPAHISRNGSNISAPHDHIASPMASQITGSMAVLNPQTTGSSASLTGQNLFQHASLESSPLGLNASIAELVNATFQDGTLIDSQLIGEIALNYVPNTVLNSPLPIEINLKVPKAANFSKVMLNQAFLERTDSENFKINPQFIDGRTLGAIKYSMKDPVIPIVIHPVWRFEPHQASVVLTLKFAPTVPKEIKRLVLEDLVVFVSIDGAEVASALSKPQGSFNKEKRRITWRFKEPLVLEEGGEERLIARFLTNQTAHESEKGVAAKFIIHGGAEQSAVGSDLFMEYQEVDENNPFGGLWNTVAATRTVAAGNYHGLA
ncbi:hypothetical protein HG537_0D02430 [Torulaspora globosa]|uniref:MHD domain-containing protein n=1 Tax=Torulaspora globosa TaxID=48254 RepID=A0A7H9HV53_9SACH|nr:hypothetical protein HG537_0D02430 [Torulaspora sp. CBS 2947]